MVEVTDVGPDNTPRMTLNEIIRENGIVKEGFMAKLGHPFPEPIRAYAMARARARNEGVVKYTEHKITSVVNLFKGKESQTKFLSQKQRDIWWDQFEYSKSRWEDEKGHKFNDVDVWRWDAYCVLIGLPPISRVKEMFPMFPEDVYDSREWPYNVAASVSSGLLLNIKLEEWVEFIVWFTGGWPETFMGILDKKCARRCYLEAAQTLLLRAHPELLQQKDVEHINPGNVDVFYPVIVRGKPLKIRVTPANFTDLMEVANPDKWNPEKQP